MPRLDVAPLATLLAAQDGLLTRRQLADLGADVGAADRRVASGAWQRLLPQVFLASRGAASERQHARAALLYGGTGTTLTGRTACRTWGLRDVPAGGEVDLLLPHGRRLVGGPGLHVHRTRRPVGAQEWNGLVLTPPAKAVVHAATDGMTLQDVRGLVLAAVADHRVALRALHQELDAVPQRAGAKALKRALLDAARGSASAPEAEAYDLLAPWASRLGLPLQVNPEILLHGELLGLADLYLPTLALGLEVDSRRHHAGMGDLDATLRRHARFAAAGVRLLHTTPSRLRLDPRGVLHEVEQAARTPWLVPSGVGVRLRTAA